MKYLFAEWNKVKAKIKGKHLFIFFDFDGTLAPIAPTPDEALLPRRAKELLKKLATKLNLKLAFISGRSLVDLKKKLGLKNVIYSGNHGLQIEGPKIKHEFPIPSSYKKALQHIKIQLKEKLSGIKGVFVEDKKLSLALHYRLADKRELTVIKTIFRESVIPYLIQNKIRIRFGKMVFEVNPPLNWDKGKVVLWLLARQQFASKGNDILPIYIGDDVTDEDAFKVLKRKGLTVFVGKPGNSKANYYLKNPREVIKFLRLIYELKN